MDREKFATHEEGSSARHRTIGAVSLVISLFSLIAAAVIVLPRIATSIQSTDGPELAYLSVLGGLAHPPGYPLYSMIASLAVRFFSQNPYFTLSCLSAVATFLTILLLGLICSRLTISPVIGWLCALTWAFLPVVIDVATDADVFAFHHLLIAALLAVMFLPSDSSRRTAPVFFLTGLIFGLGMAHHLMMVLWVPLLLAFLVEHRSSRQQTLAALFGAVLGYSSIFLIIYRYQSNPDISLAPVRNPAEFIVCILRLGYGAFSSGISDDVSQQRWLIPFLAWTASRAPVLLIGPGLFFLLLKRGSPLTKGVVLTVLAHLWFCWQLTSETGMSDMSWIGRFFGAPALALTLLTAVGIRYLSPRLRTLALSIFLLSLWQLPGNLAESNRAADGHADQLVRGQLSRAPRQAIFLTSSDLMGFGGIYLQRIEKIRLDLLLVHDSRLGSPHYRQVLDTHFATIDPEWTSTPDTIEELVELLCLRNLAVVTESAPEKNLCQS